VLASTALKKWRIKNGLTQERAAALATVTLSTWRNWERGRNMPKVDVAATLEKQHPGLYELLQRAEPRNR